ncbi:MAG: sugar kinase [Solirubrobacterales bacterium]
MTLDVLTFGEAMLRLSPPIGVPLARATNLDLHVAGAEANVAVALSSLGRSVTWVSRLPANDLGRMVSRDLAAGGVDISHVSSQESGRLGTYFVELGLGPKRVSVAYDRQGSTAAAMSTDDLPLQEMARARLIHLTGITPALSRSCREATEAAATAARDSESLLSVDINYRAQLWSAGDARECLDRIAAGADLVVCTAEDARDVFGLEGDSAEVAASLADRLGSSYTVVTNGADGAVCWHNADAIRVAATPTQIVDRLGAGDAFTAGVIDGLLDGDIGEGLRRGSVLAAVALATRGDQVGVTRAELTQLLEPGGRRLNR